MKRLVLLLLCLFALLMGNAQSVDTQQALIYKDYLNHIEWPDKSEVDTLLVHVYSQGVYEKLDSISTKKGYSKNVVIKKKEGLPFDLNCDMLVADSLFDYDSLLMTEVIARGNILYVHLFSKEQYKRTYNYKMFYGRRGRTPGAYLCKLTVYDGKVIPRLHDGMLDKLGFVTNRDLFHTGDYIVGNRVRRAKDKTLKRVSLILDSAYFDSIGSKRYFKEREQPKGMRKKVGDMLTGGWFSSARKTTRGRTVFYDDGRTKDVEKKEIYGLMHSYYESGQLASVLPYENGSTEGFVQRFYPDGVLSFSGYMRGLNYVGPQVYYYPNGRSKREQLRNERGALDGQQTYYYKNQIIRKVHSYKDGVRSGYELKFDTLGNGISTILYSEGKQLESIPDTSLYLGLLEYVRGKNRVIRDQYKLQEKQKRTAISLAHQSSAAKIIREKRKVDSLQSVQAMLTIEKLEKDKLITGLQAKEY